jgi:hypothetical protein
LKQAEDGTTVEEVCRKAGLSIQTYYRLRRKYGGLMPSEMKRLKELEEEDTRLIEVIHHSYVWRVVVADQQKIVGEQVNCFVITLTNLAVCGGLGQPSAGSLRS